MKIISGLFKNMPSRLAEEYSREPDERECDNEIITSDRQTETTVFLENEERQSAMFMG